VREHVDLPTVDALKAEWDRHPPVHHLVAAYLDYKPPVAQTSARTETGDIEDFLTEFGNVPIRQVAPLDTTAFDAQIKEKHHG
jgi:hypothetical protein